jgi:hypothetical protein
MKKIFIVGLVSLFVNIYGQDKILTTIPDSLNVSLYVLDGLKMDKETYVKLQLTKNEIERIILIDNPKELKRKHYEPFGGKVLEVYSNLNFIVNECETLRKKRKYKVLSKMPKQNIWEVRRVPLIDIYTKYGDFSATSDAISMNANIPEGLSVHIDTPLQDTIIDKVTINGCLINETGKSLKYAPFRDACIINWTNWKIMLIKDSLFVRKGVYVPGPVNSAILKKGTVYHFSLCLDMKDFRSEQKDFQPIGEYEIWIHFTFGLSQAKSNKIRLYFKSSLNSDASPVDGIPAGSHVPK